VLAVVVLFALYLRVQPFGPSQARAVDDLGQLAAAAAASAAALWRSRRSSSRQSVCWLLMAAATGSWAVGEGLWSYYELLASRATPFPSLADGGFLLFAVLAVAALMLWPSDNGRAETRWRGFLDGVLVAGSLFIISWVSALGSAVQAGGDSALAYGVSLAYPVSDLILLSLTVLAASQSRRAARSGFAVLAAGLTCLCLADSGFAYLTAVGRYSTGSPVDICWFGGFLLIGVAALTAGDATRTRTAEAGLESRSWTRLPYLPAGVGLAVALVENLRGDGQWPSMVAAAIVISALLGRQLLTVLDNRRLLDALVEAQHELRHQAFHDPLTGLANRALFTNRLRHGLDLHQRDLRPLALLYCDLDGFKGVNDTLGHESGDVVLRAAAERLLAVTRAGETVGVMGVDEFAFLIEDGAEAAGVAARILSALNQPAFVGRELVALSVSIGVVELTAGDPPLQPGELLSRADAAMYEAKRSGKGRVSTWSATVASEETALEPAANT
jgi:diguanylate cyclase (GGDEF)-like protein